jgi:glycolate oxidase FAD binding subunit
VNAIEELVEVIRDSAAVTVVGARTHADVGGAVDGAATEVHAPAGILAYEPADMTVTVLAGTRVHELDAALAEHGQECALEPRDDAATVGGVMACGLSGLRRLRTGPVRDRFLEVHLVTGDAQRVRGGGPTVKNVTGYDLPRLLVGSLGTLGVATQVTLRTQPRPASARWSVSDATPGELRHRLFKPSCLAWDGKRTHVLLEGHPDDIAAEETAAGLSAFDGPPALPDGAHRGRASVPSDRLGALAPRLDALGCSWLAEGGVGTVHVATDDEAVLLAARVAIEAESGWLLREHGAPRLDPFGVRIPNVALASRIKDAFDPDGKLNPGRLPYARSAA